MLETHIEDFAFQYHKNHNAFINVASNPRIMAAHTIVIFHVGVLSCMGTLRWLMLLLFHVSELLY